jgi:hypothetical protein
MQLTITAHTMLDVGTDVMVNNQVGKVESVRMVQAVPSGVVALHKIHFTHKREVRFGKSKLVAIKPVTREVNYSFIQPLS